MLVVELPVCQKHSHKAWDLRIGLKTGLKNRVPQHVAEDCVGLDGIGTSLGGPPSRFCARDGLTIKHHLAKKDKQRNNVTAQDCLQSGTWFIYTNRR